ncbi:protein-export membrane protein SecF [Candidatus Woesebacteria bacterium RIFCSPHIGHO2_01_FULL_38_9]|uniref:Protein-export membrane protein SecF n=2 Tax=Candidatus Woeseibacteriota TaxID=1752722 RepID=A0A1F7XZG9_9BACT|nr:MAG: protein-export membrane protein SecF [Candidatus Woesebacteria bacterium RIFCSPHIGHO2_01_FULL_38_9]OGM58836.1 MAG: protein-export membrane protein SecF [Candidatus Woesebacteria bacterium RIFCSPLOWO2_01_FULL_39_10]
MINWMAYRKIYFFVSGIFIALGIFGLLKWGLFLGVDFKGGTIAEYKFQDSISTEEVTQKLEGEGIETSSIQITGEKQYMFRMSPLNPNEKDKFKNILETADKSPEELRFETVGPTIGPELVKKTLYAAAIASIAILLWVAYQFKSIMFGASAILAMFHDTFMLIGAFALLGHFFGAEVDFLFVTALLTTLSFSVHDTIVVYDRIRESQGKFGGNLYDLANKATTETMVRSLNNSFTILFMLVSLMLLGGSTIKWFAVALLIGTVSGTYSSPFVAVPLLVTWGNISKKVITRK